MSKLDEVKRAFQHAILAGMADSIWTQAYRGWIDHEPLCKWCERPLHLETVGDNTGMWVDDEDLNTNCPETDDSHQPVGADETVLEEGIPPTPDAARLAARDLSKLIAKTEGVRDRSPMADLFELAMNIDRGEYHLDFGATIGEKRENERLAKFFGMALAHMAMGVHTGLWSENHRTERGGAVFAPAIPTFKVSYDGTELTWEGAEQPVQASFEGADEHPIGPNEIGRITIVNPGDAHFHVHNYLFALGAYGDDLYLVYAAGESDAAEELIVWIAENAPGYLVNDSVKEQFDEQLKTWHDENDGVPDDDDLWKMQEEAEVDTISHDSNYLNASEVHIIGTDLTRQEIIDIAFKENPRRNAGVHEGGPGARLPSQTQAILEDRRPDQKCSANCPGWAIFDSDTYGLEPEACDECNSIARAERRLTVTDADIQALPQAQRALLQELGDLEQNPGGRMKLTAKGERMYKAVEKGYKKVGEARAKEVAARTVMSRVKQGARGLVRNAPPSGPECPRGCGGHLRRDSTIQDIWRCGKCGRGYNEDQLRSMTPEDREAIRRHARRRNTGTYEADEIDLEAAARLWPRVGSTVRLDAGPYAGRIAKITGRRRGVFTGVVDGETVRLPAYMIGDVV